MFDDLSPESRSALRRSLMYGGLGALMAFAYSLEAGDDWNITLAKVIFGFVGGLGLRNVEGAFDRHQASHPDTPQAAARAVEEGKYIEVASGPGEVIEKSIQRRRPVDPNYREADDV